MKLRFVSGNEFKIKEARVILGAACIEVIPIELSIEELQTVDASRLVRDKAARAFEKVGRPLFVEHTGLKLTALNGFPGGLTQIFWDTLREDRFSKLFGSDEKGSVEAVTDVCYIDGKEFHQFVGSISGRVGKEPRGPRDFQWDCVFVPDGRDQTFAEMGTEEKNKISMRRRALAQLADFLRSGEAGRED